MFSLQQLNAMSLEQFSDHFGDVAEHSPWVARSAWQSRPFASRDDVVNAFCAALNDASKSDRLALIRAHPDLAGRAAIAGELAQASTQEQAGAGLDSLSAAEFDRFTKLNDRYRAKFGFPLIFAVKGADKHQILAGFEARIDNDAQTEFDTAEQQVKKIMSFRLHDRIRE